MQRITTRRPPATLAATREESLVVLCARTRIDERLADRSRAVARDDLDWRTVARHAYAHGVLPLVYRTLDSAARDLVPDETLVALRSAYRSNAVASFRRTAELKRLVALFEGAGIASIPMKGPVVASVAYDNLLLRAYGDLDIIVRRADVRPAGRLLESAGYRARECSVEAVDEFMFNSREALTFDGAGGQIVELHWTLIPRWLAIPFDLERAGRRLTAVTLGGQPVRTFDLADTLRLLLVHGGKHEWSRLIWLCDVAELIQRHRERIDWDRVFDDARSERHLRLVTLGLLLAAELLAAPLPPSVDQRARADRVAVALKDLVVERVFSAPAPPSHDHAETPVSLFLLRARDSHRDRVRMLVRRVTNVGVEERDVVRLPTSLRSLYLLIRLARVGALVGGALWRRAVRYHPRGARSPQTVPE